MLIDSQAGRSPCSRPATWLAGLVLLGLLLLVAVPPVGAQPGLAASNRSVDEMERQLEVLESRMRDARGDQLLQIRDKVRALRDAGLPIVCVCAKPRF